MTIETLHPNGIALTGGATGSAADLDDANNATYAVIPLAAFGDALAIVAYGSYTLAGNERCRAVTVYTQYGSDSGADVVGAYGTVSLGWPGPFNLITPAFVPHVGATLHFSNPILPSQGFVTGGEWTQANLDSFAVAYGVNNFYSGTAALRVFESYLHLDIRHRAVVDSVSTPTGAQSTRRPSVAWSATLNDGQVQKGFRVKVFTEAVYLAGGFNPDTSPNVYDSDIRTSTSTSHAPTSNIAGDGNLRAYVQVSKDFNSAHWWSAWVYTSFSIADPPPTPTVLTPLTGATVNTNLPTLGATLGACALGARVKAQWQIASDSGFTTGLRTVTEPDADVRASGATTEPVPPASALSQGTRYVRVRAVSEYGSVSGWSASNSFTVSHPPSSINRHPQGGLWLDYGSTGDASFDWDFADTSSDDSQTAYQIAIERNSDATSVLDTGKVTETDEFTTLTIPGTEKDVVLRWRIRLWDVDDVAGAYSGWELFHIANGPSITPTAPAEDEVVTSPTPTFSWVFAAPERTQAQYRITIADLTDVVVYDSGWLVGTASTHVPTDPTALLNDTSYVATYYARDNVGLEVSVTRPFSTAWTPPAAAAGATVDESVFNLRGFVGLSWTNDAQDVDFYSYRIYIREGTAPWSLLNETLVSEDFYFLPIYMLKAGIEYHVAVVQVAERFGVVIESDYDALLVDPDNASHYWLLDSEAQAPAIQTSTFALTVADAPQTLSVLIYHVTADDFNDEQEMEVIKLIGRGRKADFGTNYGYVGTLTLSLRNQSYATAQEQRLAYRALRDTRVALVLRNPFGDLWKVVATDMSVSRMAGVGLHAVATVTLPYAEVV